MFTMVSTASLALIEQLLNQAIKQDNSTLVRIAKLEGKVIAVCLKQPKIIIYIQFNEQDIRLLNNFECVPELTITGASFDFLQLALADDQSSALFSSRIRMDGDEHLAQKLMTIATGLSIDWEYLLSKITGDVIAHQLGNTFRSSSRWIKETHQSMTANLEEYIHHELRTLPHSSEVDYFCEEVTSVRLQADRLSARIKLLEKNLGQHPEQPTVQGANSDES